MQGPRAPPRWARQVRNAWAAGLRAAQLAQRGGLAEGVFLLAQRFDVGRVLDGRALRIAARVDCPHLVALDVADGVIRTGRTREPDPLCKEADRHQSAVSFWTIPPEWWAKLGLNVAGQPLQSLFWFVL